MKHVPKTRDILTQKIIYIYNIHNFRTEFKVKDCHYTHVLSTHNLRIVNVTQFYYGHTLTNNLTK